MEITEVRVKLVEKSRERLRAFCSVTFDGAFVIRDLKVIGSGSGGGVFVAMPSRKLCDRCPRCRAKNHLRARFCNECGHKLVEQRVSKDSHGRAKIHADVAHPINTECREMIQSAVIQAYEEELERSKSPDYKPPKFDEADEALLDEGEMIETEQSAVPMAAAGDDAPDDLEQDSRANESAFSDYDSLIAELRQEAAKRDDRRRDRPWGRDKHTGKPRRDLPSEQATVGANVGPSEKRAAQVRQGPPSDNRPPADEQQAANKAEQVGPESGEKPASPPKPAPTPPAERPEVQRDDDAFGAGLT